MKNNECVLVNADKTSSIYQVIKDQYENLLRNNITKDYKIAPANTVELIDNEAKQIAQKLGLADRIEVYGEARAFITLKDHKEKPPYKPCKDQYWKDQ